MKRAEKNQQSRQKIIDAALWEFSEKGYAEASLNALCSAGKISKGIIYHYFKSKDDLYLFCVQQTFDALADYLSTAVDPCGDQVEKDLQRYFAARINFFKEWPVYLKLFYSAVVTAPPQLAAAIQESREKFDAMNTRILTSMLKKTRLRAGITMEDVIRALRAYQDYINTHYQIQADAAFDFAEYENNCRRSLDMLLYGVVAACGVDQ